VKRAHTDRALWIGLTVLGAAAVAGGLVFVSQSKATPGTPSGPSPSSGGPVSVTLLPAAGGAQTIQRVDVKPGNTLTILLPAGASWSSNNSGQTVPIGFTPLGQALPVSGNTPLVLTFAGGPLGIYPMLLAWTDSSGVVQATVIYAVPI
jgi:hypothetical protein